MSNKTTFEVTGVARLDISQVKQAAEQIKNSLQGVTLPGGIDKNLASIFQRLNDEIAEFEVNSKKATTNADWSNVIKSGEKILGLYSKMEGQIRQLGDISDAEMKTLFPPEVTDRIKKAEQAIKNYTKATSENAAAVKKQQTEINKLQGQMDKKQGKKAQLNNQTVVSDAEYKNMQKQQKELGASAVEAQQKLEALKQKQAELGATMNQPNKSSKYRALAQEVAQAEVAYQTASQASKDFDAQMANTSAQSAHTKAVQAVEAEIKDLSVSLATAKQNLASLNQNDTNSLNQLFNVLSQIDGVDLTNVSRDLEGARQVISQLNAQGLQQVNAAFEKIRSTADGATPAIERVRGAIDKTKTSIQDLNSMQHQVESLKNSFLHFFSLTNGWMLLRRGIRAAYESVKEMDAAMTEIAVVSEYTLDDVWEMRDTYVKAASDMGASTIDLVNATKLYVQQGMSLTEAQEVGIETTKMARIANLDGAEATNLMTAALRGFNMEMNEANRVNDVYSQLAAKSAADTEEIATAMSKTASIAANAGASFENTSAFLTQIIETTREAPETAGTALKTIIARFQELKKAPSEIGEVDGEMVNANAIETALKTAGVELRNAQGEFRNFDDVIIELAGKWDSLDVMTQRYIATMAAGSRQQSRFIALMADSERLMELTGYAANSAGASQEQFNKTLDSLESKMNRLRNAWELYLQNLTNSTIIKTAIDLLSNLLETVNKLTAGLNKIDITKIGLFGSAFQTMLTFFAFKGAGALISKAFNALGPAFFKAGQQGGHKVALGAKYGMAKGLQNVQKTWEKFTKWLSKSKVNLFKDSKTAKSAQNEIKAIGDVKRAKRDYDKTVKASGATSRAAAQAQQNLVSAQIKMTQTMGLSEGQMAAYNAMTQRGIAADTAALAAKSGLTQETIEETIASMSAAGASDAEIAAKIKEMAANGAATQSENMLNTAKQATIATRFKALGAILFGNKQKAIDIMLTSGLITAEQADAMAKSTQTGAQWALNAATYAFPGAWLLLVIVAIVAAVALLVGGIMLLCKAIETDAEKMERLTKTAEEAKETFNEAQDALANFKDETSEYKDGIKGIQELTKGTQEYRDAIRESNLRTMELLSTYSELAEGLTVGEDGLMIISDEALQKQAEKMAFQTEMASSNLMFAKLAVEQESYNQKKENRWKNEYAEQATFTVIREENTGELIYPKYTDDQIDEISDTIMTLKETDDKGKKKQVRVSKSNIGLTEEQLLSVADKMGHLEEGTESYANAVKELQEEYGLAEEQVTQLINTSMAYDNEIKAASAALEQFADAAIASALSFTGLIEDAETRQIVTEVAQAGISWNDLNQLVTAQGSYRSRYMGEKLIRDWNIFDNAGEGMKMLQTNYNAVLKATGQEEIQWTNADKETDTIKDIVKHYNPNVEVPDKKKKIDDNGEGLRDELEEIAKTTYVQLVGLILEDAMAGNEKLVEMLNDTIDITVVSYQDLYSQLAASAKEIGVAGEINDYIAPILEGSYLTVLDNLQRQHNTYTKISRYVGEDYDKDGSISAASTMVSMISDQEISEGEAAQLKGMTHGKYENGQWVANGNLEAKQKAAKQIFGTTAWLDLTNAMTKDGDGAKLIRGGVATAAKDLGIDESHVWAQTFYANQLESDTINWRELGYAAENFAEMQSEAAKDLYGKGKIFANKDQLNKFGKIVDPMNAELASAVGLAYKGFGTYKNGQLEFNETAAANQKEFLKYLEETNGSVIETATALREMQANGNAELQAAAETVFQSATIGDKAQVHELYDIISEDSEALAELTKDGEITASEMMELGKTNDKVAKVMENTRLSAAALADYYDLLADGTINASNTTEDFIKVISKLKAAANTIEDTFALIDSFEAKRSQTEIGSYFGDIRSEMEDLINKGAFGDQRLMDYAKLLVGDDELQNLMNIYEGDLEQVMQQVLNRANFGENFYSMWTQFNSVDDMNMVDIGSDGAIIFNLENIESVEALITKIKEEMDVSEEIARAMVADAQTFSGTLAQGLNQTSVQDALEEWLNTATNVTANGKTIKYLSEAELNAIAKTANLDKNKLKGEIEDIFKEMDIEVVITPELKIDDDGKIEDGNIRKPIKEELEKSGDIGKTYQTLINLGLDPSQAEAELKNFVDEISNEKNGFQFTLNGKVLPSTKEEIKTAIATAIAEGYIDPKVAAAQALTAANEATQLASGTSIGVAIGMAEALNAFMKANPRFASLFFGDDFKEIDIDSENGLISEVTATTNAYRDKALADNQLAYNQAIAKIEKANNEDATTNKNVSTSVTSNVLGSLGNSLSYVIKESQLGPGESPDDKEDPWEHDYDWLYNLEKQIAKTVRERNKLETEYNRLITQGNFTQGELLKKLREQESLEQKQLNQLAKEKKLRTQEKNDLKKEYADVAEYVTWNEAEQRVQIDYDAIDRNKDNDIGKRIEEAIDAYENVQDELEQIEDDTNDIKDTQADRLREQLDEYKSLEERLYDAIVSEREKEIEELETLNETVSNAASEMLDKIQTGIDDSRQAREDEEALSDIEEMERRLALMRSDTSGANALDILSLEDELEQARQDFMDNKIDQAIDQLSRQNELAQQQREEQISLMNQQLEWDKSSGAIASQVNDHLTKLASTGNDSVIKTILKSEEGWAGMAAQQKKDWADDLIKQTTLAGKGWKEANAASNTVATGKTLSFTDKNGKTVKGTMQSDGTVKDSSGNTYSGVFLGADGKYHQYTDGEITAKKKPSTPTKPTGNNDSSAVKITDSVKKKVASNIWNYGGGWGTGDTRRSRLAEVFGSSAQKEIQSYVTQIANGKMSALSGAADYNYANMKKTKWTSYATGGLADFTGPAWLDGTKARPEYVLNAEQTKGFLALVDMLGDFDSNPTAGGDNYYDVHIEVDELSNDYDVEQMMDKMKRIIADDAMYRNVNAIDLGRR